MNIMITGSSRGIGLELVKYFANRENTTVFALTGNVPLLYKAMNSWNDNIKASVIPIQFKCEHFLSNAQGFIDVFKDKTDTLDILINNAGLLIRKPFADTHRNEMLEMLEINTLMPAVLIQHLLPWMGKNGGTHVVNIGSMGGFQGSVKFPGLAFYSASKAALSCLTECLQEELKESGITINCLALGSVQTEMLQQAFPGYQAKTSAAEMASFIGNFALTAHRFVKGKIIPVTVTTP